MDLVRFAQLDPRVIVADSNRNSTEPIDFQIIVNVTKTVMEPLHQEEKHVETDSGPTLIAIFGSVLFVVVTSFILTLLYYKKKLNLRRTCQRLKAKRCCCKKKPP